MNRTRIVATFPALLAVLLCAAPSGAHDSKKHRRGDDGGVCKATAQKVLDSCLLSAAEEARVADAICLNETDREARRDCASEATSALREALDGCKAQNGARQALCREPGFGGAYDPEIDPDDFVAEIDAPLAPFRAGARWVYESHGAGGVERVEVEVLGDTREILDVETTAVRDRVFEDGELIEDTTDWVAQDREGNVWYFGELAQSFEDGLLRGLDGSWEAGVHGAKPGFWVKAQPEEGELYRQEWLPGEAEDVVEVLAIDSDEVVPFANGMPVLQTRDFTPLEPDKQEQKFYVPGVGLVLELDPGTGERLELIEHTP